ncbi:MAG: hypothetical protein HC880_11755 [Bacteroidia bacterium]|nr:hypothetical protein [Bacteroidia bacterium]
MSNPQILSRLVAKPIEKVLEAYVYTWGQSSADTLYTTPSLSVYLSQGNILKGDVVHVDFEQNMLSIQLPAEAGQMDVCLVSFAYIQAFTLHSIDRCAFFMDVLSGV